ncbi:MAG TPA: N-acetylmuramoyl-L-alanine amidase [Polyangia bacterium]|jgi:N-acetylmuramoyl-L-alanine amidase|nr:N-acetylmuramoyl-L-alanine amidase [Polyangia bacterium]
MSSPVAIARSVSTPARALAGLAVACALALLGPRRATAAPPASARPSGAPVDAAPFVVVLDPGHGGSNLGAAAADGLLEKDVTLALARRVRARLETAPGVRVVVCRERDVLVPIRARARCAAAAHADLFVSLHANATPAGVAPGSQRGFELYVLPPEDVEDDATLAALAAPPGAGVWAAHVVRATAERSATAARKLDLRLRQALGERLARGVRQTGAALDVLRGTGAPGVLVEVGFLDNVADRTLLTSAEGQDRVADALASAALDARVAASR